MTFRNCVFSANLYGLVGGGAAGTTTETQVTDSEVSYNAIIGALAQDQSTVTLSNTTVTHNSTGVAAGGTGDIRSFQDNRVSGNSVDDGTFTTTLGKI
jgi:hypothetical protein